MKTEMRFLERPKVQNALGVFLGICFVLGVVLNLFSQVPLKSNSKALLVCVGKVVIGTVLLRFATWMLFQDRKHFASRDHIMANLVGCLLFLGGAWPIFQVVSFAWSSVF